MARDFYEDIEMQNNRITGLDSPVNPNDAVTKSYVDLVTVTATASYTAQVTDDIVLTAASVTLYSGNEQTSLIAIKNVGIQPIDIFPAVGETIENKSGLRVKPRNSFTLAFNGTNWNIV